MDVANYDLMEISVHRDEAKLAGQQRMHRMIHLIVQLSEAKVQVPEEDGVEKGSKHNTEDPEGIIPKT
jgi:hypothetical protein